MSAGESAAWGRGWGGLWKQVTNESFPSPLVQGGYRNFKNKDVQHSILRYSIKSPLSPPASKLATYKNASGLGDI